MTNKNDMQAFENFLEDLEMKAPRKEYKNRWDAKLVNPAFTLDEYEKSRNRACKECKGALDTSDTEVNTCFECYQESFRKGN